jgi:hypothetical protein
VENLDIISKLEQGSSAKLLSVFYGVCDTTVHNTGCKCWVLIIVKLLEHWRHPLQSVRMENALINTFSLICIQVPLYRENCRLSMCCDIRGVSPSIAADNQEPTVTFRRD